MQAVGAQLFTQDVCPFLGEEREEVDEVNLLFVGELLQAGVYFRHKFGFVRQQAVAAEAFVDGQ